MSVSILSHLFLPLTLFLFLTGCTGRKEAQYREALSEARRQNLAYEPVTGDSLLRCAVDFFDRHGTANDRLLSRYLLGCAYRDLHEAPLALITWEDAVACADTLSPGCDYATLFRVYGQMADVYNRQHLPEKLLAAENAVSKYAILANDTFNYIRRIELQVNAYYILEDSVGIFQTTERARRLYAENGMQQRAAQVYAAAIHFLVNHRHFEQSRKLMEIYENESGLFDERGNIVPTREQYYYYKGMYFLGIGRMDSAEKQFRKLLPVKRDMHDAYLGLFSLYQKLHFPDSALKYAQLYEEALIQHLKDTKIEAVTQAQSLYDYQRNERIALEERHKAGKARRLFIAVLTVILISFICIAVSFRKNIKRRRHEFQLLLAEHADLKKQKDMAAEELQTLRAHLDVTQATQHLLHIKEEENKRISAKLEEIESRFANQERTTMTHTLLMSEIFQRFKAKAIPHLQANDANKAGVVTASVPVRAEWQELEDMVGLCLPRFYHFIKEDSVLTTQELRVALLIRLGIGTKETALLLGTTPSRVSTVKEHLNLKLFGEKGTKSLFANLKAL